MDSLGGGENKSNGSDDDKKDKKKKKKADDPFLLSGSKVLEGKGHYVVIAVGPHSFQGKIFMSLRSSQPDQTRMQKQLADLAEKIAKLASIAGGLLFLALFIRNCVDLKTKPDRTPAEKGQGFLQSFVISVTLVVVAVPEGEYTVRSTIPSCPPATTDTESHPLLSGIQVYRSQSRSPWHSPRIE